LIWIVAVRSEQNASIHRRSFSGMPRAQGGFRYV
jgi:hypothetical protein